ncbi:PLP-dependent aminotransferase family protein [Methylocystis sp. 9N]|uniref:PLP-dependent aminotransferase family protein n=1 Tax=Methylocystis borbori TaxID=3118750 RepID=A0ABU7XE36_9HYPH
MELYSAIDWSHAFAPRMERMRASEIRELLKLLARPEIISFAGGIPDPALFPIDAVRRAYDLVLADRELGPASLQYSISEGYEPLRLWISQYMARRGVTCGTENIIITAGSQQGLDLLGKLFLAAGDIALVSAPTYLGALQAFGAYEPRYLILTPESSQARTICQETAGGRVALAYVVPDFANPTGETMGEAARRGLLGITAEAGVPLIEDAAYEALRFEGVPQRSCLALDVERCGHIDRSHVLYCGTFSKTISPGLRVGWICAARNLIHKLVLAKQAADLHSATLNQMVLHRLATSIYDDQVAKIVKVYGARRDVMFDALVRQMPDGVSWTEPMGGMFIWVTLPVHLDGAELLTASIREEGVAFVPGRAFFADGNGCNTLRLNYSLQSEAGIEEGIGRLGRLITRKLTGAMWRPRGHSRLG